MLDKKKIAIIAQAVKLPGEKQGLDRIAYVAETLASAGYDVTLYTSKFQHWDKEFREIWKKQYRKLPYRVVFLDEPGYSRNIDLRRIYSHHKLADHLSLALAEAPVKYDLVYCLIPPNDLAHTAASYSKRNEIPLVVDVSDLWPEAMKMALNVPVLSDIAFLPFSLDAKSVYRNAAAVIGTSDEYATRPLKDNPNLDHVTVYVGNNLSRFDSAVSEVDNLPYKPENEFWVTYAGTLGKSYDIDTLIDAAVEAEPLVEGKLRVKILGDGPDIKKFALHAKQVKAPVDFLGYVYYDEMCCYLAQSDVLINSLVKGAPQSIVSKIADYLAAAKPIINTGESREFKEKVENDCFGINVEPQDVDELAAAIVAMSQDRDTLEKMGKNGRKIAEEQFDRPHAYQKIVELIDRLVRKEH